MSTRDGEFMRRALAMDGIFLDESPTPMKALEQAQYEPDRQAIRSLLATRARPEDLEWLTASCPSVSDAMAYRKPPRIAWCARCDEATVCDENGCVACQSVLRGTGDA